MMFFLSLCLFFHTLLANHLCDDFSFDNRLIKTKLLQYVYEYKVWGKKTRHIQKSTINKKNPHFLSNPHETWLIVIFTKFHEDLRKIMDFSLMANFWKCLVFFLRIYEGFWRYFYKKPFSFSVSKFYMHWKPQPLALVF